MNFHVALALMSTYCSYRWSRYKPLKAYVLLAEIAEVKTKYGHTYG
jgi:hypothetical protein